MYRLLLWDSDRIIMRFSQTWTFMPIESLWSWTGEQKYKNTCDTIRIFLSHHSDKWVGRKMNLGDLHLCWVFAETWIGSTVVELFIAVWPKMSLMPFIILFSVGYISTVITHPSFCTVVCFANMCRSMVLHVLLLENQNRILPICFIKKWFSMYIIMP